MSHKQKKDCPNAIQEALGEMKSQYQTIHIPEDLKTQVEHSICQARQDLAPDCRQKRRRPHFRIKHFSAGAAAAVLALAILANSSASIAHAMGQVPFLGVLVDIITFREYGSHDGNMEANLKIPEAQVKDSNGETLEEATEQINSQIHSYTQKIIAAYLDDVKASDGKAPESVDLDYEVATDNDKLFSLRFHKTLTMASAEQSEKIYHIDKETGKMATLKDLFQKDSNYREVISQNIKEQMREQMEADEEKTYYIADIPSSVTRVPAVPKSDGSTTYFYYTDGYPLNPRWDFSKNFMATPLEGGTAGENTHPSDSPSSENAAKDATTKDNTMNNGTSEGNSTETSATEDNPAETSATEDNPAETSATGDNPTENSATGDNPTENSAMEDNPAENSTMEDNPTENGSVEDGFYEISDDVNFYINESGKLVVVFDEYEVAPGSMGAVSFEIPTDILDGIVKEGYLY